MVTLDEWKLNKDKWLDKDLALLTTDTGWKTATKKDGITIWQQPFPDDKNNLFRWKIPALPATHTEVFDVFVNKMIDYHHYWTKEYSGGFLADEINENAQVVYQQFNPGIPGISNRDFVCIQWSRQIDAQTIQTSFRTLAYNEIPVPANYERIDWWGSHLFKANADGTSQLSFIDRENQGGLFPSFMMNKMMPGYLIYQYKKIIEFFNKGGVSAHQKLPASKNTALILKPAAMAV